MEKGAFWSPLTTTICIYTSLNENFAIFAFRTQSYTLRPVELFRGNSQRLHSGQLNPRYQFLLLKRGADVRCCWAKISGLSFNGK